MRLDPFPAVALLFPLLLAGCHPDYIAELSCDGPAQTATPSSAYAARTIVDLKSLAYDGDRAAARVLGERHEHGEGVPIDLKQAVRWYEQAAIIPPTVMTVWMPGYGKVPGTTLTIPSGTTQAGDAIAMAHLGRLYMDGKALPFDESHGRTLLNCAAAHGGSANADMTLGWTR
jgi:TPR repeat protein